MNEDLQLLLQTHKGNEPAARRLWARFSPRMLAYARAIVRTGEDDVVQSVFVSVLTLRRAELKGVEDVGAWLLTLTRRAALNHLRTHRRELARRASSSPAIVVPAIRHESLAAALGSLPRRLREVVILRHIAGLTFDQVALALGANRNTAASRYREAIRQLRSLLGADADHVEPLLITAVGDTP